MGLEPDDLGSILVLILRSMNLGKLYSLCIGFLTEIIHRDNNSLS